MKRFFAFILATMMIISIVPISPVIALGTPTFSVSETEGSAGEEVTLAINVESNPGVVVIGLQIGYDSSVLELKSAVGKDFADTSFGPTTGNPFHITWEDVLSPNNTNNGVIAELTFLIKDYAPLGETALTVSYDEENVFNSSFKNVYFATQNGKVTVVEKSVAVTGVRIDETLSVNIGEKKTPSFAVIPSNASNKAVSFVSSNPSVASVNEMTGEITGVSKGTTSVTVTTADGGFSDTCTVTVSCPHTNKTSIAEKPSTCTEQGWGAYSKCDTCGQLFNAEGNEISEIPYRAVLAHTLATPIRENEIDAGCETAGSYDEVIYCSVCSEELSRERKTVLATGHEYGEPIYVWSEDNKTVTATRVCTHDETHIETETSGTAAVTVKATCEADGKVTYTATFKNAAFKKQTKEVTLGKLGHEYSGLVWQWSESYTAKAVFTCENDPTHVQTLDADVSVVTVNATCEADGKTTYTASVIFEEKTFIDVKVVKIEKLSHEWGEPVYVWSEDNKAVTATRVCAQDETHIETETVKTTVVTVEPTAEYDGKETYTATFESNAFEAQTREIALYLVRFVNFDGSVISYASYRYGDKVAVPANPERADDERFSYAFAGWDKDVADVTGSATYTATYIATPLEITVVIDVKSVNGSARGGAAVIVPNYGEAASIGDIVATIVEPTELPGDVDGDGKINAKDYAMAKRTVIGTFKLDPAQTARGDLNGNGKIDARDYAMIKRHVIGSYVIKPADPAVVPGEDFSDYAVLTVVGGKVDKVYSATGESKSGVVIAKDGYAVAIHKDLIASDEAINAMIKAIENAENTVEYKNDTVTVVYK